ncbi:DNA ligase [Photobacterium sp. GB-210]|uniref:DNA ligase n=1 Tax=Photobacterium sp. GB-210 TaxID=2022104 RepID=UPI000D156519|nr:DNA ligase [Photobacterium sp. GB-210]PSV34201.1 DNA ligase [Photobacterium sp. GB-210]
MINILTAAEVSSRKHLNYINKPLSPIAALVMLTLSFSAQSTPELMKAKALDLQHLNDKNSVIDNIEFPVREYLVSEKLDGIRAYWNGTQLTTKSGRQIHAPHWFIKNLPAIALDGELWLQRGKFQALTKIVMDHVPNDKAWRNVKYMVFDLPASDLPFEQRYNSLVKLIQTHSTVPNNVLYLVEHKRINEISILTQWLDIIVNNHGEGLMLQHINNYYVAGRTNKLLKLKQHQDAEAIVIGYEKGNGKYQGLMGSIWVKTINNKTFKIGTGFTEQQRKNPPPLGTTIQFRYNGYTERGIPRFARFSRVRLSPDT